MKTGPTGRFGFPVVFIWRKSTSWSSCSAECTPNPKQLGYHPGAFGSCDKIAHLAIKDSSQEAVRQSQMYSMCDFLKICIDIYIFIRKGFNDSMSITAFCRSSSRTGDTAEQETGSASRRSSA